MGHGCSKSIIPATKDMNLYVIATVFNPCGFNSRVKLYKEFAKRLSRYPNVRLYTTECVFGDQKFSVTNSSNPRHIQLRTYATNIWWIKENLINMTVAALPESSQFVSWMDADIEFMTHDWVDETIRKLSQRYKVLQLFKEVTFLGPNNETLEVDKSFGYHIADNDWKSYAHPGLAWAMRKEEFLQMGGLYDRNPVGSSDLHFAHALIGNVKNTIKNTMSSEYKKSVCDWADRIQAIVGKSSTKYSHTVGYVNVNIRHHYHGNKSDRQYVSRWDILEKYNFDPNTFFIPSTPDHVAEKNLRIISDLVPQSFKNDIREYFHNRREDNTVVETTKSSPITDAKIVYGTKSMNQSATKTNKSTHQSSHGDSGPLSNNDLLLYQAYCTDNQPEIVAELDSESYRSFEDDHCSQHDQSHQHNVSRNRDQEEQHQHTHTLTHESPVYHHNIDSEHKHVTCEFASSHPSY